MSEIKIRKETLNLRKVKKIWRFNLLGILISIKNKLYITNNPNNHKEMIHKRRFNGLVTMFLVLEFILLKINPLISKYIALMFISYSIFDYFCRHSYIEFSKNIKTVFLQLNSKYDVDEKIKQVLYKLSIANVVTKLSKKQQI